MCRRTDPTVQRKDSSPFALSAPALRVGLAGCLIVPWLWGCHVPQKPGQGTAFHRSEATTQRPYWLYLPKGYVQNKGLRADRRRYPLVVSFHGMRPFDDYRAHMLQWQSEADRYGFIVCAPRLDACDVMARFPIDNRAAAALHRDEQAVLRILDEVFRLTNADPDHVLATSFSSGGYLAHYLLNRHPERFSCLAVFQSNFTAETLDVAQVAKYRHYRVAILTGDKDFPLLRAESIRAIEWYRRHGFTRLIARRLLNVGHERTPELAAPIFAATARVGPSDPASVGRRDAQTAKAMTAPDARTYEQGGSTNVSPRGGEAATPFASVTTVRR